MKRAMIAMSVLALTVGAAQAQSNSSTKKQNSPGTTGAMGNVNANGVATDPGGVAAQQKGSAKSSPGTVGAAPGADTPSQKPKP